MKTGTAGFFEKRRRKPPKQRMPLQTKNMNLIELVIQEMFPVVMKMHYLPLTLLIMMKLTTPL